VPLPNWSRDYRQEWLAADVIAGLTVAAVVIPKALAYASIAGLPLQVGLYTAFTPMLIYALLGTSRPLSVSTTTTIAILVAAALDRAGVSGATANLMTASATLPGRDSPRCSAIAATWLCCRFHFRAGAGRFQGRHWHCHRRGSVA
jgi:SulP family sulfate permease